MQPGLGEAGQGRVPFDRVHAHHQLGHNRRGVARAGADLEHAVGRIQARRLDHASHDIGLRDRLAFLDGQGAVLVGEFPHRLRQKGLSVDFPHGCQHPGVVDATSLDLALDHTGRGSGRHENANDGAIRGLAELLPARSR
jgi:hypothetical protein